MYLVTGATGNVGHEVAELLLATGKPVRVFTRDESKVSHLTERVEIAKGDMTDPASFAKAADGTEGIFLMNGVLDPNAFRQIVAAVKAQGSPRIVFLSTLFAADPDSPIGQVHKDKEDVLLASSLHVSFVRAGNFMTNTFQWLDSMKTQGLVFNAMGSGRTAPIAPEDIAAVATYALTHPEKSGQIYEVTGGELLTLPQQVAILSRVLGKPVSTKEITPAQARENLLAAGFPPFVAAAVSRSYADIGSGKMDFVRDTVEHVKKAAPVTYEAWVAQNASRLV